MRNHQNNNLIKNNHTKAMVLHIDSKTHRITFLEQAKLTTNAVFLDTYRKYF